jgi:hypothetical protein
LLNKNVFRKELGQVLSDQKSKSQTFELDLIAGFQHPCAPAACCQGNKFVHGFPCVLARRGVSADNYLYNIAFGRTYITTLPLIQGSAHGNRSTIHMDMVQWTSNALNRNDEIISYVMAGKLPMPGYIKPNTS